MIPCLRKFRSSNHSFTLIEVIIFIGILSIFFVTSAAIVTYSIQSMTANEHKIIATQYAEDLLAWIRAQKEADWNSFSSRFGTSPIDYCFNTDPVPDWPAEQKTCSDLAASPFGSPPTIPPIFNRDVELTADTNAPAPATRVTVKIKVWWTEPTGTVTIPLNSELSIWENP